jgi:hypothetical protein
MKTHFKIGDIVFWFDPNKDDCREGIILLISDDGKRVTAKETDTGTIYGLWTKDLL